MFRPCAKCGNTLYELREGYTICLSCGFICSSLTGETNFKPIGFKTENQNIDKTIKKIRRTKPEFNDNDILNRLHVLYNLTDKELKRALRKY